VASGADCRPTAEGVCPQSCSMSRSGACMCPK
jgi:hypothetical protein